MVKPVTLSIIIINFKTLELTRSCLSSVFNSLANVSFSYEIILVDNGSDDTSGVILSKEFPQVTFVQNKTNIGFGAANNYAIGNARGEYILLLNSDCTVIDTALEKLLTFLKNNPHISFAGGKLFNTDHSTQASCGPFLTLPVVFLMLFAKGEQLQITRYSPDHAREVDWISGACILGKKVDFVTLKGFDEGIFLYMEEVELFYRAKKRGMTVWFTPDAHFTHVGSGSSKEWKTPVTNLYKGLIYFYKKHESFLELFLLRFLLTAKALIGITAGALLWNKRIFNAYKEGLKVSFS